MKKENRSIDFDNLELRDDSTKLVGYASTFEPYLIRSLFFGEFYEQIERGAFEKSIREDEVFFFHSHNPENILGSTLRNLKLSEDDHGLRFELELLEDHQPSKDLAVLVREGVVSKMSIGFIVEQDNDFQDKINRDGQEYELRKISQVRLFEVSSVAIPANSQTTLESSESRNEIEVLDNESDLSPDQKENLRKLRLRLRELQLQI